MNRYASRQTDTRTSYETDLLRKLLLELHNREVDRCKSALNALTNATPCMQHEHSMLKQWHPQDLNLLRSSTIWA